MSAGVIEIDVARAQRDCRHLRVRVVNKLSAVIVAARCVDCGYTGVMGREDLLPFEPSDDRRYVGDGDELSIQGDE